MRLKQRGKGKIGGKRVRLAPGGHLSETTEGDKVALNPKNPKLMPLREYERLHMGESVLVFEPEEEGARKKSRGKGR